MNTILQLPNGFRPRKYQKPLWNYLEDGGRHAVVCWARRHGKDEIGLHILATKSQERVGNYVVIYPYQQQVRSAIWDGITNGVNRVDNAFPPIMVERKLDQTMTLHLKNGSTVSFVGSDNPNALVGANPVGIVMSEFAMARPEVLGLLRPILAENKGWLLIISTPRGRNHFYNLLEHAKKTPGWFAEELSATDTDVFTPEALNDELVAYQAQYGEEHGRALFAQEFLVSFASGQLGSIYGSAMENAEREGRIGIVPYDPALPVTTAWDLGMSDSTAIWFLQQGAGQVRAIDYYANHGMPLSHYIQHVKAKPYIYAEHIGPHDLSVRELGSGRSRAEMASELKVDFTIAPRLTVQDGINATRMLLPKMWFDRVKCENGISALQAYRKLWDDKRSAWSDQPYHDWASDGCDALRMYAVSTPILSTQEYKTVDRYDSAARRRSRTGRSGSWMSA